MPSGIPKMVYSFYSLQMNELDLDYSLKISLHSCAGWKISPTICFRSYSFIKLIQTALHSQS